MEQHADRSPPARNAAPAPLPKPQPQSLPPDRAHWTPGRQRIFLAALLDTGSVTRAARAAGMSRSSAHRLRLRLAGTPFERLWDQALVAHARQVIDPFASDRAPAPVAPRAQR